MKLAFFAQAYPEFPYSDVKRKSYAIQQQFILLSSLGLG